MADRNLTEIKAVDKLLETIETWAENIDRASLVQDRSVNLIKQACRMSAKELRAAIADYKQERVK